MGESYEFGYERDARGNAVAGYYYRNADTCWEEMFKPFTPEQLEQAEEWQRRMNDLMDEKDRMIERWLK